MYSSTPSVYTSPPSTYMYSSTPSAYTSPPSTYSPSTCTYSSHPSSYYSDVCTSPLPSHNTHRTFYQLLVQKFNYLPAKLSKRSSSKSLSPRTSSPRPFFPLCYHSWRAETHVRACLKACNNAKHRVEGREGREGRRNGEREGGWLVHLMVIVGGQ